MKVDQRSQIKQKCHEDEQMHISLLFKLEFRNILLSCVWRWHCNFRCRVAVRLKVSCSAVTSSLKSKIMILVTFDTRTLKWCSRRPATKYAWLSIVTINWRSQKILSAMDRMDSNQFDAHRLCRRTRAKLTCWVRTSNFRTGLSFEWTWTRTQKNKIKTKLFSTI